MQPTVSQNDLDNLDVKFTIGVGNNLIENTVPIYTNNTRMPDSQGEVYSSTLCILKGIKHAVQVAAKNYYDKSIEEVTLTIASDEPTDLRTLRQKADTNNRVILPAMTMSMQSYKFLYAPSNNIERFAKYYYNGTEYLISYIAIPAEFKFGMRYYATNYDLLLRFSEGLAMNSQLAFPDRGFDYQVLNENNDVQIVQGYIVVDGDNSNHKPKQVTLKGKEDGQIWSVSIPCYAWAAILSRPFLTRAVTIPQININLNPTNKPKQGIVVNRFVNIMVDKEEN